MPKGVKSTWYARLKIGYRCTFGQARFLLLNLLLGSYFIYKRQYLSVTENNFSIVYPLACKRSAPLLRFTVASHTYADFLVTLEAFVGIVCYDRGIIFSKHQPQNPALFLVT